jgi:hypothetical protein
MCIKFLFNIIVLYPIGPTKVEVKAKVKLSLSYYLTERQAMKAYWGSGSIAPHTFLTSELDGGEWSASPPGKKPLLPVG